MISTCRSGTSKSSASSRTGTAVLPPMSARRQPHLRKLPVRSRLMQSLGIFLLGMLLFLSPIKTPAQTRTAAKAPTTGTGLLLTGAVGQDLHLSLDDLKKMPRKSVSTRDHAGEMHQYDGVPIGSILAKAGVPQGAALRGKSMALALVAEGTDGYRAIFSLAELDDDFAAETVLIVDSADGQSLSSDQGPLCLVVPGDKRPARWVRMLKSLTVVNLSGIISSK